MPREVNTPQSYANKLVMLGLWQMIVPLIVPPKEA